MMKKTFTKLFVAFLALLLAPSGVWADAPVLLVNGIDVSTGNNNILSDGKVSYNATNRTLTLADGATLNTIVSNSSLIIDVLGNATVNGGESSAIKGTRGDFTIKSSNDQGQLTLSSSSSVATLDISGGQWIFKIDKIGLSISNTGAGAGIKVKGLLQIGIDVTLDIVAANSSAIDYDKDHYSGTYSLQVSDKEIGANNNTVVWTNTTDKKGSYYTTGDNPVPTSELHVRPNRIFIGNTLITGNGNLPSPFIGTYEANAGELNYYAEEKKTKKILTFTENQNLGNLYVKGPDDFVFVCVENGKTVTLSSLTCNSHVVLLGNGTLNITGNTTTSLVNITGCLYMGFARKGYFDTPQINITNSGTGYCVNYSNQSQFYIDHANVSMQTAGSYVYPNGTYTVPVFRNCTYTPNNGQTLNTYWKYAPNEEVQKNVTFGGKTVKLTYLVQNNLETVPGYPSGFNVLYPPTSVALAGISNPNNVSELDFTLFDGSTVSLTCGDGNNSEYTMSGICENAIKDVDYIRSIAIQGVGTINDGAFTNLTNLQTVSICGGYQQYPVNNLSGIFSNITSGNDLTANPLPPVELVQTAYGNVDSDWAGGNWDRFYLSGNQLPSGSMTLRINFTIETLPDGDTPGTVRLESIGDYTTAANADERGALNLNEIVTDPTSNLNYRLVSIKKIKDCPNITSIKIPSSVTQIGADAFQGCENLASVSFLGSKPAVDNNVETGMFTGIAADPDLYVLRWESSWDDIISTKTWGGVTWNNVSYYDENKQASPHAAIDINGDIYGYEPISGKPTVYFTLNYHGNNTAEITSIYTTEDVDKLRIPTTIELDNVTYTIKQVNANALKNSNHFSELIIPSGLLIEDGAFANLSGLKKVTFEDGCVKSDYGNIFSNITSSASLEADPQSPVILICPNTWEDVANNWAGGNWRVMANDEFIEELALPILQDNIHTVDLKVVYKIIDEVNKKVALVDIIDPATEYTECMMTIPNTVNTDYTVTQIGTEAFKDIDWLYGITMPSGLTAIEDNAFVNLTNLDYISFSNVTAEQSGFDYGEDDVKFSNIKYSDSQKTRFIKPDHWEMVWDDWGAGDVSIWNSSTYGSVRKLVHYGIFIDDVEITDRNKETFEENDVHIYDNHLQIQSDVEWGSMRIENVDEDNDEPFVIVIPEENTVTLTSGLVCNMDVIISGDGTLNVSSNSGATVQIADGKNLTIGDDQSNVIPTVNITNTGGYACVSGGTESSLGFYKANVTMETSGKTLISGFEAPTLSACVVTDGGFDESSVTIEPGLGVGAVVTNYFINDDYEYLDGYYTVTGRSPMIASFGNAISGGVSGEKPDEIEAASWDLIVPETVTDIDTQIELAVTSIQYGLVGTSYVNSLTLPKTITSIQASAISNVDNFKKLTLANGTSSELINNIAVDAFANVSTGVANENPVLGIPYDWDESNLPDWDAVAKTTTLGGITWDVEKNALFIIGEIASQTVQVTGENGGTLDLIYTITKLPTDTENGQVVLYKPYQPYKVDDIMSMGEVAYENPQPENVVGAVTLEPTVTIKGYAFDVVAIGANAFSDVGENLCPHISSITIPDGIENIYNMAFASILTLDSVIFKGSMVESTYEDPLWGEDDCYAFYGVKATLTVPASWGLVANDWNAGTWTSINYVKEVELDEAGNVVETTPVNFAVDDPDEQTMSVSGSEELTEEGTVVIPATVTLGTDDFTVTAIGDGAFEGQTNLTGATLPKTVTSIGENAFAGCTNMTSLTVQSPFAPTVGEGAFTGTSANLTVNYPAAAYAIYNEAGWAGVQTFQPTVMQPNEWSTICSTQDYEVPEGLEAYIVVGIDYENCAVKVKKMDYILADTPMMLRKIGAAEDYPVHSLSMIIYQPDGEQLPKVIGDEDAFIGYAPVSANADPMEIPDVSGSSNMQAYILIDGTFVKWTEGNLAPYRCFLWATQAFNTGNAPQMGIEIVDGETTGVGDVRGKKDDVRGEWYDLSGRKLQGKPTQKGVYIINGKKVNVK